eukprot:5254406-Amphidinium_carterae.2
MEEHRRVQQQAGTSAQSLYTSNPNDHLMPHIATQTWAGMESPTPIAISMCKIPLTSKKNFFQSELRVEFPTHTHTHTATVDESQLHLSHGKVDGYLKLKPQRYACIVVVAAIEEELKVMRQEQRDMRSSTKAIGGHTITFYGHVESKAWRIPLNLSAGPKKF